MDFEINGSTVTLIDPGSSANSSHQNSDPNEAHIPTQIPLGTQRWEHKRAKWIAKHPQTESQHQQKDSFVSPSLITAPELSSDANSMKAEGNVNIEEVISILFSNRWDSGTSTKDNRFPTPVPLPLMVEILVDFWEAEGLDI